MDIRDTVTLGEYEEQVAKADHYHKLLEEQHAENARLRKKMIHMTLHEHEDYQTDLNRPIC